MRSRCRLLSDQMTSLGGETVQALEVTFQNCLSSTRAFNCGDRSHASKNAVNSFPEKFSKTHSGFLNRSVRSGKNSSELISGILTYSILPQDGSGDPGTLVPALFLAARIGEHCHWSAE